MKNVLLFSGGRTSGYMLRRVSDATPNYREEWLTIFCNTGKEMPQTLDFVRDVQENWGIPIVWLEYHRVLGSSLTPGVFPTKQRNQNLQRAADRGETVHWFKRVNYKTASRDGRPFDELLGWMSVLPNVVSRGCSMQLKIRTAMRYLFSTGLKEYASHIGIRKDEAHRSIQILANCDTYEHPKFPLIESGKTEADILDFWRKNDFDLQLKSYQGNCDMCFLKAKWKRVLMVQQNPGMVDWWQNHELAKSKTDTRNGSVFRLKEPYSEIVKLAKSPTKKIAAQIAAEIGGEDIPCSCAERGFESDNGEV